MCDLIRDVITMCLKFRFW